MKQDKSNNPELSLFLPVLDEEENLRPMHAKIAAALDALGKTAEVIYVDDGSTDKSLDVLKEIAASERVAQGSVSRFLIRNGIRYSSRRKEPTPCQEK